MAIKTDRESCFELSFMCTVCLRPTVSEVKSSVDIGGGSSLEIADEFCYLGDILSVEGDAHAAVT